jgi:hypothetical protein
MIVVYRMKDKAVFLYGFAKSERDNMEPDDLRALLSIAAEFLAADEDAFDRIVIRDKLLEIKP